jgi:hypothetical protein
VNTDGNYVAAGMAINYSNAYIVQRSSLMEEYAMGCGYDNEF